MIIRRGDTRKLTPSTQLELKTVRAKGHLDEIKTKLREVFVPEPYAISCQDYPKKFLPVIRVQTKTIPFEIPMLVGDIAFGLAWTNWLGDWLVFTPTVLEGPHLSLSVMTPPKGWETQSRTSFPLP